MKKVFAEIEKQSSRGVPQRWVFRKYMFCNVTVLRLWSKSLKRTVEENHIIAVIQPVTLLNYTPAQVIFEDFDQSDCFRKYRRNLSFLSLLTKQLLLLFHVPHYICF